jgi:hypothetical protein
MMLYGVVYKVLIGKPGGSSHVGIFNKAEMKFESGLKWLRIGSIGSFL